MQTQLYKVANLLTEETWDVAAPSVDIAVYTVVLGYLHLNAKDFREETGRWTFGLVNLNDDRIVYCSVRAERKPIHV